MMLGDMAYTRRIRLEIFEELQCAFALNESAVLLFVVNGR
jgi:hypothetical protein